MAKAIKNKKTFKDKKKESEQDIDEKLGLFDMIPENCMICDKGFDKKDKKQVQSWFVAVREEEKKVNLYCPDCWERAQSFIKDLQEGLANEKKQQNS